MDLFPLMLNLIAEISDPGGKLEYVEPREIFLTRLLTLLINLARRLPTLLQLHLQSLVLLLRLRGISIFINSNLP